MDKKTENTLRQMKKVFDAIDSIDDVDALEQIYGYAWNAYQRKNTARAVSKSSNFAKGDKVMLIGDVFKGRRGRVLSLMGKTGIIEKCNPTKAKVRFGFQVWTIGYNSLMPA